MRQISDIKITKQIINFNNFQILIIVIGAYTHKRMLLQWSNYVIITDSKLVSIQSFDELKFTSIHLAIHVNFSLWVNVIWKHFVTYQFPFILILIIQTNSYLNNYFTKSVRTVCYLEHICYEIFIIFQLLTRTNGTRTILSNISCEVGSKKM